MDEKRKLKALLHCKWLTSEQLSWLTSEQLSWLTSEQLSGLTSEQLSGLTSEQLSWLDEFILDIENMPVIKDFYSSLLKDINDKKKSYKQSTFGKIEDFDPKLNVCGIPMCIGGHWVNSLGKYGYYLLNKYGKSYDFVATIAHRKSYPNMICFNYMVRDQDAGWAYIEAMAAIEAGDDELKKEFTVK
jgi:hypothetical protein